MSGTASVVITHGIDTLTDPVSEYLSRHRSVTSKVVVLTGALCSAAQLEQIVRSVRRAQANAAAELDPEAAAWSPRTRVRYDDAGNFTFSISGPAEHLPVIQAGIEAKKAELQRQRDAESQEQALALAAVPAEMSSPTPASTGCAAGAGRRTRGRSRWKRPRVSISTSRRRGGRRARRAAPSRRPPGRS